MQLGFGLALSSHEVSKKRNHRTYSIRAWPKGSMDPRPSACRYGADCGDCGDGGPDGEGLDRRGGAQVRVSRLPLRSCRDGIRRPWRLRGLQRHLRTVASQLRAAADGLHRFDVCSTTCPKKGAGERSCPKNRPKDRFFGQGRHGQPRRPHVPWRFVAALGPALHGAGRTCRGWSGRAWIEGRLRGSIHQARRFFRAGCVIIRLRSFWSLSGSNRQRPGSVFSGNVEPGVGFFGHRGFFGQGRADHHRGVCAVTFHVERGVVLGGLTAARVTPSG